MTEDTDDISYKRLCDLFNFFQDWSQDKEGGDGEDDELKESVPVINMYKNIRKMAIDKKKTFRELFIVG